MENKPNKLINELSPYLIQHAYNPVDWHAWNDEAFAEAKRQNKPVFLSIGYSACHWCHVMEKESFDDPEIANMMNQTFINIKVDREERPDIDHIYMTVCQVMTGSGGWPLTVLMTPDKKPFFAGTYFPKETIGNRVGIKDVIKRTQQVWSNNYRELLESADEITAQINFFREPGNLSTINKNLINKAFYEVAGTFDEQYGGFSKRPKFPIPHNLTFLLRYSHIFGNSEAAKMALFTLQKMRFGGIYDHIGKGFHRYSTDREWIVPHFEKMLYDQALLAISFTEAYLHTKDKFYKKTALDILDYVKRELASPEGGFYSAEDADSEGEEGKFYLWNFKEIRSSLIGNVEFFCDIFNIQEKGNYHDEFTGELNGKNIPHLKTELSEYGEKYNLSQNELENKVSELINKLFEIRETRKHPHKDDKILTDWNGMMIAAFAYSGRAFGNMEFIEFAKSAANFIINQMSDKNGRLFHRYRNGSAGILGMLDDYAAFIWGLIELFKSTSDFYYIEQSERLMKIVMEDFYDNKSGGFFFTSIQAEQLIIRKKELYDGASPSGNSMMLSNLINLWKITAYNEYNETIQSHIKCFELSVSSVPSAYTFFMAGLIDYINGGSEIVITGNDINLINETFDKFNNEYLPGSMIVKLTDNRIPEWLNDYKSVQEPLKIFVCRNYQCESPFYNLDDALKFVLTLSN